MFLPLIVVANMIAVAPTPTPAPSPTPYYQTRYGSRPAWQLRADEMGMKPTPVAAPTKAPGLAGIASGVKLKRGADGQVKIDDGSLQSSVQVRAYSDPQDYAAAVKPLLQDIGASSEAAAQLFERRFDAAHGAASAEWRSQLEALRAKAHDLVREFQAITPPPDLRAVHDELVACAREFSGAFDVLSGTTDDPSTWNFETAGQRLRAAVAHKHSADAEFQQIAPPASRPSKI